MKITKMEVRSSARQRQKKNQARNEQQSKEVSYIIAYQQKALAEYEHAVLWYTERSPGAAGNFESAVNERTDLLRKNPARYKKTYKQFHQIALKQYPYSIIYFINEAGKQVIIFLIYHHK